MSASARYPTGCPTCGAAEGESCRTISTGRVTDTHLARILAAVPSGYKHDGDDA